MKFAVLWLWRKAWKHNLLVTKDWGAAEYFHVAALAVTALGALLLQPHRGQQWVPQILVVTGCWINGCWWGLGGKGTRPLCAETVVPGPAQGHRVLGRQLLCRTRRLGQPIPGSVEISIEVIMEVISSPRCIDILSFIWALLLVLSNDSGQHKFRFLRNIYISNIFQIIFLLFCKIRINPPQVILDWSECTRQKGLLLYSSLYSEHSSRENQHEKSSAFLVFIYFSLNQSFPHLNLTFLSPSAIGVTTAGVKAARIWLHTTDTSPAEIKGGAHHRNYNC